MRPDNASNSPDRNQTNLPPPNYSLDEIALMIKRHSHDVRNTLNGMELELTLLDESATTPEIREAISRLRESGSEISRLLQTLSARYSAEPATTIPAVQLAEIWRTDARRIAPGVSIDWQIHLNMENVTVESALLRCLLKDVLGLAVRIHGRRTLTISCHRENALIVFQIAAPNVQGSPSLIETQQAYWAALCRLGQRSRIDLEPKVLTVDGSFPMRLVFPVSQVEP